MEYELICALFQGVEVLSLYLVGRIRIRIKVKGRIRIRIKVKSRIRARIRMVTGRIRIDADPQHFQQLYRVRKFSLRNYKI